MDPESSFVFMGLLTSTVGLVATVMLGWKSKRDREKRHAQLESDAQAMIREIARSAKSAR
jgi:hypothetical protein